MFPWCLGRIILMLVIGMEERAAVATEAEGTAEARVVVMEAAREDMVAVAAMAATERRPKKRKIL